MRLDEVDTQYILDDGLPWLPVTPCADLVSIKLLAADPVRGETIALLRAPPGVELPRYRTTCATTVYTLRGRWKFREYDWVAGPGSLVIVPADRCGRPLTLHDGTDDVVLLVLVRGELQLLDEAGRVAGTEGWRTAMNRYLDYCRTNHLEPRDLMTR